MDYLDKIIKKMYMEDKKNTYIPSQTEKRINETIKSLNNKKTFNFKYKVASFFTVALMGTSIIAFANGDFEKLFANIFNYDNIQEKGIQSAVDCGYVQNTNMEYIECNETKFKIDYVTMDDSSLAINFNFLLNENADNYQGLAFYDLKIYDDKSNLIYTEEERYPNDGIALGIAIPKVVFIQDNNIIQSLLIESDRFPKTRSLCVKFSKITLYNVNEGNPITKDIVGNFDINIPLEEKFYNRETIEYEVIKQNANENTNLKINRVFLTDTTFNIIVDNNSIATYDIEIKNNNGDVVYSNSNIFAQQINDEGNNKVMRLDFSKYDCSDQELLLKITEKKFIGGNEKEIFLFSDDSDTNVHNIKELQEQSDADSKQLKTLGMNEYKLKINNSRNEKRAESQ